MTPDGSGPQQEMAHIQDRLDVAEETLRALQAGEVDAIVMATGPGEQRIYTLDTEDRPYRRLVERMSEGAALVDADALIVYANQWLATLLAVPLQRLLGHPFTDWLGTEPERSRFIHRLATAASGRHDEYTLHRPGDGSVQVLIGVSVTQESDGLLRCLTVTDLSPQKAQQQAQHRLNTELTARLEAEAALHKVEQRVALLDERQRIAEDLHDLVIQRLFAAGLELEAVRRSGDGGAARIDSAIEGIDDVWHALRASIHNLKMGMEPADLAAAVDRVVRQAARRPRPSSSTRDTVARHTGR